MQKTLSTKEQSFIKRTLDSYQEKEQTTLDELKLLDKKVKKTPRIFSYTFGTISSLILGFGMSVAMGVILPEHMALGIIIGIIGLLLVIINYSIYKKWLSNRKNKYSQKIIELSKTLLNE